MGLGRAHCHGFVTAADDNRQPMRRLGVPLTERVVRKPRANGQGRCNGSHGAHERDLSNEARGANNGANHGAIRR